jgi:DNA (cytosine-5)-methyltransferase 1
MFTFIDLFAGIGGFRIGLERLGGQCVFSSEIDRHAAATYERNFGEKPAGDITRINPEDVPRHDVLCGGFPCQPFSVSGKQRGFEDARGTLFFQVMRLVAAKRPRAVFLENVANYARHQNGDTLKRTLSMLEGEGYRVSHAILNASDFGVPQARKRLYIVGVRSDTESQVFKFPKSSSIGRKVAVKDILVSNDEAREQVIDRSDIRISGKEAKPGEGRPAQIGTINKGGQGERIYSVEGHGITLCRRMMGFQEWFSIDPRRGQAYKQFGNAVVVPVIEAIGKSMLESADLAWKQAEWRFDELSEPKRMETAS